MTRTLGLTSLLEVRVGVSRTKAGKTALGTGSPNMFEAYGITGLPTDTVFAGGLTQQSVSGWTAWGRQSSNPQFQDPLVIDARLNYSWIRGRHTFKAGYEYQHINTDIDDVHPKYGADGYAGQFSRPTGAAADAATFNLADFLFGARNTYELVNPFVFELRQRMHFGYVQDDWRVCAEPDVQPRAELRARDAAVGKQQLPDELRPGDQHADPGERRIDLRPRARQPRPEQFRAAARRRLQPHAEDRHPLGLRHELHPLQPARRREPPVVQRSARRPDRDHAAAVAGGVRGGQAPTSCFRTTQEGYPEGLNVPANFNPLNGRVNYIPPDTNTGNVQNWHVTVQRELLTNLLVDVAYIGNRSRNLVILGDYNQARPNNAGEDMPLQARRPIQGYQFIQAAFDGGKASYHALQVKVERRYTRGLYFLNSFTWSKASDNASGHLETANGDNSRVNLSRHRRRVGHLGLQPADQQHDDRCLGAAVRPRSPLGERAQPDRRGIVGGWRLTAINTMTSGLPVNLSYSPSSTFQVSGVPTYRPNLIGDVYGDRTIDNYFNKDNVVIPTDRTQPFGDAPRNVARGPAIYSLDLGLHKGFGLGLGDSRLEFRIEAFNALNKTNFGAPNGNRSSTDFGTIRTLSTRRGRFSWE